MPAYLSGPRSYRAEDAFTLQYLQGAKLSPDGRYVVYAVSQYNAEKDRDDSTLHLIDLDAPRGPDGKFIARQLTSPLTLDALPDWSPDSKQLTFLSARTGVPQIYILDLAGGEARKITDLPQGVGSPPVWSPDGKWLAFTAGDPPDPARTPTDAYRVTRQVYRFNGPGYLSDFLQDIYIVAPAGGSVRRVTRDGCLNADPLWSPDSTEILYSAIFSLTERWQPGLRVVNVASQFGEVRDIVWTWGTTGSAAWSPDGQSIVFMGGSHTQIPGTKTDLYRVPATAERADHPPQNLTTSYAPGVGGGLQADFPSGILYTTLIKFDPAGNFAYMNAQVGGVVELVRVALNGPESIEPVIANVDRTVSLLGLVRNRMLIAVSTLDDPAQLALYDVESKTETPLTEVNRATFRKIGLPETQKVVTPGYKGDSVESWLMLPTHGTAPHPCVVVAHGGPWGAWGYTFASDFHMLAGAGYAVLFVNYHGSSGYGSAFGTSLQGNWGAPIFEDHMAILDKLVADKVIDGDRLGIMGLSAGGYTTCLMVGRTTRFKAAVAENPVTNLATLRLVGDIGLELISRSLGGTPDQAPDAYRDSSPITDAAKVKTPTLLILGEADWRCPAEQGEQFYAVLRENGCPAEMLRLPNSDHAASIVGTPSIRRAQDQAILRWMNRWVLGT